jgi:hypothetical protein
MSRFVINGVFFEPKSSMPEELAQDKTWSSEVQELPDSPVSIPL